MMKGRCLCGLVEIEIKKETDEICPCDCGMCRRQAAGPAMWTQGLKSGEFEVTCGSEFVETYKSSNTAERQFCLKCGTILSWHDFASDLKTLNVELFDNLIKNGQLTTEYYYDYKPDYYDFQQKTRKLNENFEVVRPKKHNPLDKSF